ncbi:hypothetical protein ACJ41O_006148 [Fusarium nematophilum]
MRVGVISLALSFVVSCVISLPQESCDESTASASSTPRARLSEHDSPYIAQQETPLPLPAWCYSPPWGRVLLLKAAEEGNPRDLATLLRAGVDPFEKNEHGNPWSRAFYITINGGDVESVRLLVNAGVDPGSRMSGFLNEDEGVWGTPLTIAIERRQLNVVEWLVGTGRAEIAVGSDSENITNAVDAAAGEGFLPSLRVLVEHPTFGLRATNNLPTQNPQVFNGQRLLIYATSSKEIDIIEYVLDILGIPPPSVGQVWTRPTLSPEQRALVLAAIGWACSEADSRTITYLLRYFLDSDGKFLEAESLDRQQLASGRFKASCSDDAASFVLLMDLEAQRRQAIGEAETEFLEMHTIRCLQWAASHGSLGIVQYIVENESADVNKIHVTHQRSSVGLYPETVLHLATRHRQAAIVKYLVENAHADGHIRNEAGSTPIQVALVQEDRETVQVLLSHGGPLSRIEEDSGPGEGADCDKPVVEIAMDISSEAREVILRWRYLSGSDACTEQPRRRRMVAMRFEQSELGEGWLERIGYSSAALNS